MTRWVGVHARRTHFRAIEQCDAESARADLDVRPARALILDTMRAPSLLRVVTEEERAAAAAFTNIPRSLASAATPTLAGWMLAHSAVRWPLFAGAICKFTYDVLLLVRFRHMDRPIRVAAAN